MIVWQHGPYYKIGEDFLAAKTHHMASRDYLSVQKRVSYFTADLCREATNGKKT